MASFGDAFFFTPDYQRSVTPLAYLVTEDIPQKVDPTNDVFKLSLGVLGVGIIDSGTQDGAAFGTVDRTNVPVGCLIPQLCVPENSPSGFSWLILLAVLRRVTFELKCP